MQGTIQKYTLDMADGTALKPLIVKQGDTNSRFARISLVAFKEPWTIPFGCQIHINVHKNDGTYANATCTQEDEHTVLAPITEQMTAVPGTQLGELFFLGVDGDIRSQTFPLVVWDAVSDLDRMVSSDDFQALKEALRDVKVSTEVADIAAQYATEQGNQARDGAQRANDAADSIQVAVDAAAAAKECESNAKDSETAAAQTQQAVTDYVEAQKAAFAGYSKRESDSKYANALTETATGEGGVTVEDAWTAPVLGLDVAGKSEQVQTMGKNLFDTDIYVTFMLSKNDANNTVNKKVFDGRECLYINGSLVSTETVLFSCSPELVYTISYDVYVIKTTGTASGNGFAFARENEANLNALPRYTDVGKWTKITLVTTTGCLYVYPTYGSRSEQYIDINSIQIEVGSIVTEYEPYTGGAPSPSPDYPQDIISTGTVSTGAQMLNVDTIAQGMISTETGAESESSVFVRSDYIPVKPGDYILSGDGLKPYFNHVMYFSKEKVILSSLSIKPTNGKFTVADETAYIRIRFISKDGTSGTVTPSEVAALKPMLNTGDTALPWEPYTGGKPSPSVEYPQTLEVGVTGANLANITSKNNTGISVISENGEIKINGTVAEDHSSADIYVIGVYGSKIVRLAGINTYQIFGLTNDEELYVINVSSVVRGEKGETPITYNGDVTCIIVRLKAGKTYNNMVIRPMVSAGNTALPWEPYRSASAPITLTEPLRGVGGYWDRIMCRDGVWGIERYWKSIMLDGNIPYREHNQLNVSKEVRANEGTIKTKPIKGLFNNFNACDRTWDRDEIGIGAFNSGIEAFGAISLRIPVDAVPVEYMAAHPTEAIYHPYDFPTWEPFPDATQQALNELTTYAGTTHLTITAGGPAPTVTLDYVQDTHKALEQCQEVAKEYTDNQLAAIVAALPTATQAAIVDNQTTRLLQEV